MCPRAWGFESPLPHCHVTSPTNAPLVLVPKFPENSLDATSKRINNTPDKSVTIYTGANFSAPTREEPTGYQAKPPRPPERQGRGDGYMRTEVAVRNFLSHCRAQNLKPPTIKWYESKLRPFASLYPKLPSKPEQIEQFLADIGGSPHTKHAYYRALSAFYTFIASRTRRSNPMKKVSPPRCPKKVMPTLEPNELMLLLHAATSPRDRILLTLLIDSGARAAELAGLRWQDIKIDMIYVAGKSGEREIPISEETRRQLLALPSPHEEYVFMGKRGPLTRTGVYRVVRNCMDKAKISGPKLGPHRIRHTFGKTYLVSGGDVRSLQKIMGHSNITSTQRYASLTLENTIAKHHKFTPLRAVQAAAQAAFFEPEQVVKEAEEIVKANQNRKGKESGHQ